MKEVNTPEIATFMSENFSIPADNTKAVMKNLAPAVLNSLLTQLEAGVKKPRVEFHRLGIFSLSIVPAGQRNVRNPKTGEVIEKYFPERCKVHFKVSKSMTNIANVGGILA